MSETAGNLLNMIGRGRVRFWVVVLLLLLLLGGAQVYFSRRTDADLVASNAAWVRETALAQHAGAHIAKQRADARQRKHEELYRRDAEEMLNDGKPLPPGDLVNVIDKQTGMPVQLWFAGDDDRWLGVNLVSPPTPSFQWGAPMIAVTCVREFLCFGGYALWGVLWIIHLIVWRREPRAQGIRRRIDLLMLATLSTLLITLRHGGYRLVDDGPGEVGLIMIAASAGLLRSALRTEKAAAAHLCEQCRYDLTGNVSGVCPECGSEIPIEVSTASAERMRTSQ
jgi:hypothetical protein